MGDSSLETRLNSNESYSTNDLNEWIRSFVTIKPGDRVLDVCCGTGKQICMYSEMAGETGEVHGLDVSNEYLSRIVEYGLNNVELRLMKMEDILKDHFLVKRGFDWVICTYGLYYSDNPKKTLSDLKVMLKPGGRLCIIGPAKKNNKEFFDLINSLSKIPEHILFSSDGFMDETVIPNCVKLFSRFAVYGFTNEVSYPDLDSLLSYWQSTTYYNPEILPKLEVILKNHFEKNGKYTIKKEAMGVKCWD